MNARALDELPAVADDEPQVPPGVKLLHAGIQREKTEPPAGRGARLDLDAAAVGEGDGADDGQAEPRPGTRSEPAKRWYGSAEPVLHRLGDARTGIGDAQDEPAAAVGLLDVDARVDVASRAG